MSLLLDALKKAALEKQKAAAEPAVTDEVEAEVELEAEAEAESAGNAVVDEAIEFSLDEDSTPEKDSAPTKDPVEDLQIAEPVLELKPERPSTTTVSEEALEMLVYKTNKQYRRHRRNIWGSIIIGAFIILGISALFQYYTMLQEVEALERKHRLAMRAVQASPVPTSRSHVFQSITETVETSNEEKETIKARLETAKDKKKAVHDVAAPSVQPEIKVSGIKKTESNKKAVNTEKLKASASANENTYGKAGTYAISKTDKLDPVSDLLEQGWLAYGKQDYNVAANAYQQVLQRESNNRDAILGIAAIAVKQFDYDTASQHYAQLLKLDPRDQIAASAMANLEREETDSHSESRLKQFLSYQPDAAHLHFALGNVYARKGQWHQAQKEYFEAWQTESNNADYTYNLAVSLDQIGKRQQARRFYSDSLKLATEQSVSFSEESVLKRLQQIDVE